MRRLHLLVFLVIVPFQILDIANFIWSSPIHTPLDSLHPYRFLLAAVVFFIYTIGFIFLAFPQWVAKIFPPRLEIWRAPPAMRILDLD